MVLIIRIEKIIIFTILMKMLQTSSVENCISVLNQIVKFEAFNKDGSEFNITQIEIFTLYKNC